MLGEHGANGSCGTSGGETRRTGASRCSKPSSAIIAAISAPTPIVREDS